MTSGLMQEAFEEGKSAALSWIPLCGYPVGPARWKGALGNRSGQGGAPHPENALPAERPQEEHSWEHSLEYPQFP